MKMKGLQIHLIIILLFLGATKVFSQASLYEELSEQIDIVVAADGSGDYTTVNEAINAAPDNTFDKRTVIFVKNGKYVEKVEIPGQKYNITMIGEHIDSTIISYDDYSGSGEIYNGIISSANGNEIGTSTSHTMYIDTEGFILLNMTVENTAGPVGQAVAVNLGGDEIIISHCRILGNQDTYYTWGAGRFYTHNTLIEGNVDFIFGRGVAYFDSCWIYSNRNSSDITAASTDEGWEFGYIFNNCRVSPEAGVSGVSMGRPWKTYAQTVFMNSYLDDHIKPGGWSDWDGRSATCYYAEYNNYGPGANTDNRVSWAHQLTEQEAAEYTFENVFSKDVSSSLFTDWSPNLYEDSVYAVLEKHISLLIEDTTYNQPYLKSIEIDGEPLEDFEHDDRYYTITVPEGTVSYPEITYEPYDTAASVEELYNAEFPGSAIITVTSRDSASYTYNIKFELETTDNVNLINELGNGLNVQILNNPFNKNIEISLDGIRQQQTLAFDLYSVEGKKVLGKMLQVNAGQVFIELKTEAIQKGLYILHIQDDQGNSQSFKLIK